MELARPGERDCYGVGIDANIVTASIRALLSGINRMGIAAGAADKAA
jgi:2-isopropylmalate synthase